VQANTQLRDRIFPFQSCISDTQSVISLANRALDPSDSYFNDIPDFVRDSLNWRVNCSTLLHFMAKHELLTTKMFISFNTEEQAKILPTLSWLAQFPLSSRPTLYVSVSGDSLASQEAKQKFLKVIQLYTWVSKIEGEPSQTLVYRNRPTSEFTMDDICEKDCAFLLANIIP